MIGSGLRAREWRFTPVTWFSWSRWTSCWFELRRGFGPGLVLGRPWLACGDGGLVLALEDPVDGGEVGFELPPPSRHGLPFAVQLSLALLSGRLPGGPAALQLSSGFPSCFPLGAGVGSPFLVTRVCRFELLAPGCHVAGERLRTRRSATRGRSAVPGHPGRQDSCRRPCGWRGGAACRSARRPGWSARAAPDNRLSARWQITWSTVRWWSIGAPWVPLTCGSSP